MSQVVWSVFGWASFIVPNEVRLVFLIQCFYGDRSIQKGMNKYYPTYE